MKRRGLTLVEVLASVALLAIMAAICAPLMRQSVAALRTDPQPFAMHELAAVADELAADPAILGADTLAEVADQEVPWPQMPERPSIEVRLVEPDLPDADHAWLAFTCGEATVFRWVALPDPAPGQEDEP